MLAACKVALGSPGAQYLAAVAENRHAYFEAVRAQQRADQNWAQTFNRAQRVAPGQVAMLTFPRQQMFKLKDQIWSTITCLTGPGKLPWFKMSPTNLKIFDGFALMAKNAKYAITTAGDDPLMSLQESFSWTDYDYSCDLYRPVCAVRKQEAPPQPRICSGTLLVGAVRLVG